MTTQTLPRPSCGLNTRPVYRRRHKSEDGQYDLAGACIGPVLTSPN